MSVAAKVVEDYGGIQEVWVFAFWLVSSPSEQGHYLI